MLVSVPGRFRPDIHPGTMSPDSTSPRVAVIIPTFNRREAVLCCLEHIRAMTGVPVRAVVVCDGSTDGTQDAIRAQFPEAVLVEGDGNLWWSGSINAGVEAALPLGVEYCLFLNDDVHPDSDMARALVHAADAAPGSIQGAVVYHQREPERIWCGGGLAVWFGRGAYMRADAEAAAALAAGKLDVDWLPGMGTLIPSDLVRELGGIDAENFPQYWGDTDFTLRASRQGIPVRVCPGARLYNDIDSTGILLPPGGADWKRVKTLLFTHRSHASLSARTRLWRRHCSSPQFLFQFLRFYVPLAAVIGVKLIRRYVFHQ